MAYIPTLGFPYFGGLSAVDGEDDPPTQHIIDPQRVIDYITDDQSAAPDEELIGQLIDEGKAYARAELGLAKATAEAKADAAKKPVLLGSAALLFVIAGVVLLCITLAIGLSIFIGPLAGAFLATLISFGIAYGLFLWAMQSARKLK